MLGYILIGIGLAILYQDSQKKGGKDAEGNLTDGNGGPSGDSPSEQSTAAEKPSGNGGVEPLIVTEVETDETLYQKEHGLDVDSPGNDLDGEQHTAPGDSQATGLTDEVEADVGNELQNDAKDVHGNGGNDVHS